MVGKVWKGQAYEQMFIKQYRNILSAFRSFLQFGCHGCVNVLGSFIEGDRYLMFVQEGVAYVGNTSASSKPYGSAEKDGDIVELGAGVMPEPGTISPMPKANRLLPFKLPFWLAGEISSMLCWRRWQFCASLLRALALGCIAICAVKPAISAVLDRAADW